jgi:hypothetical protein
VDPAAAIVLMDWKNLRVALVLLGVTSDRLDRHALM